MRKKRAMDETAGPVVVGVDAGGTSTTALAARGGTVFGQAQGPAANASTIGVDDAADVIVATIRRAVAHARPRAIVVGAAGAGRAAVARTLEGLIGSAFGDARVTVGGDAPIALRAAIPSGPGAVLVAGTGSIAYAENGERTALAGGLGYLAGDEGSAFAIGMAAVKLYGRVLDSRARRDETTDLVARALEAEGRDGYLRALYDAPLVPAHIAALAPSIVAFAGKGNRASTRIVQEAAKELGDLGRAVVNAAGLLDAAPSIAFAGGLLRENSLLTFLLETKLVADIPGAAIVRGGDGPATGALRLAAALA
jgi:N-acetylglucosamine kinase-like BadF-type ATPase